MHISEKLTFMGAADMSRMLETRPYFHEYCFRLIPCVLLF